MQWKKLPKVNKGSKAKFMKQHFYNIKDYNSILVFILSIAILTLFINFLGISYLSFLSLRFNDAAGYISMARAYFDTGHFISNLIYPSLINTPFTRLYMPGYYMVLATSYHLLGVSIYSSILPSIFSYMISGILIYAIGKKIYNDSVAIFAALIFLLNPLVILLALSAMSELTTIAICLLAFYVFLMMPGKLRYFIFPVLISLAFIFKQTTIFIAIPMLAIGVQKNSNKWFWLGTMIFTVFILCVINKWQIFSGTRPWPLLSQDLFTAMKVDNGISLNKIYLHLNDMHYLLNTINLLFSNYLQNINILKSCLINPDSYAPTEKYFIALMLLSAVSSLILFFKKRTTDYFLLSTVLMYFVTFNLGLCLYTGSLNALNRLTLFCFPFIALNFACVIWHTTHIKIATNKLLIYLNKYNVIAILFALFNFLYSIYCFNLARQDLQQFTADEITRGHLISEIHPDKTKLFVGPVDFCGGYIYQNYPAKFSFIPKDYDTLVLLNKKYPIGAILFAKEVTTHLTFADFKKAGFVLSQKIVLNGQEYFVYHAQSSYEARIKERSEVAGLCDTDTYYMHFNI